MQLIKNLPTEAWAAITGVAGLATFITKRLLNQKSKLKNQNSLLVTRPEFQKGIDTTRDRIAAGYLALSEKLDANHHEIIAKFDTVEVRLDRLEAFVARLDERTTRN